MLRAGLGIARLNVGCRDSRWPWAESKEGRKGEGVPVRGLLGKKSFVGAGVCVSVRVEREEKGREGRGTK